FGRAAEEVACAGKYRGPHDGTCEVEQAETQLRHLRGADREGDDGAQAVVEAESEDEQVLVALQQMMDALCPLPPGSAQGDDFRTPPATEEVPQLIAGNTAREPARENPGKLEVTELDRRPGQQDDGLALEHVDEEDRPIAVFADKGAGLQGLGLGAQ